MVVSAQAIIVANSAACLWPVLVILEHIESEVCQLTEVLFDVQDVAIEIKVLEPVWVLLEQLFEVVDRDEVLLGLVASVGDLVLEVDRLWEVTEQCCVELDADLFLVDFEIEARKIEVLHPVVAE